MTKRSRSTLMSDGEVVWWALEVLEKMRDQDPNKTLSNEMEVVERLIFLEEYNTLNDVLVRLDAKYPFISQKT